MSNPSLHPAARRGVLAIDLELPGFLEEFCEFLAAVRTRVELGVEHGVRIVQRWCAVSR